VPLVEPSALSSYHETQYRITVVAGRSCVSEHINKAAAVGQQ